MKLKVFSILDTAVGSYGPPMFVQSIGSMIRSVTDQIAQASPDNMLHNHPEDFVLYELGEFDTDTGMFVTDVPRLVSACKELVASRN